MTALSVAQPHTWMCCRSRKPYTAVTTLKFCSSGSRTSGTGSTATAAACAWEAWDYDHLHASM